MNSYVGGFPTYVISGALAVLLSWLVSGCRIGNNSEEEESPPATYTGYYQTEIQDSNGLEYCTTNDSDVESCAYVNPAQNLPTDLALVMRNPVAFQIVNNEGDAQIYDPFGSLTYWFDVNIDSVVVHHPTAALDWSGTSLPEPAWEDSNCTVRKTRDLQGTVVRNGGPTVLGVPTQGRIQLTVDTHLLFEVVDPSMGDCAASMDGLYQCFQDISQCGDNPQDALARAQALFSEYISAGIIAASDIPDVRILNYRAFYQ